MGNPDEWLEKVKRCEYLPEQDIKKLCEMVSTCKETKKKKVFIHILGQVKELLLEESNIQPVRSPVTVCGDIHGNNK